MDCSLPGSTLHGILQARVLEWVAISFSRGSSQPRDRTRVSRILGRRFNLWATREVSNFNFLRNFHTVFIVVPPIYIPTNRAQMFPFLHIRANIRCIMEKAREFQKKKHLFLPYWLCQSLWLCGSQSTVENSGRDGNTRPSDLPLEKRICRSGSNS